MTLRIGIDGFNLALARGTGVAAYGRTLCEALHGMGHRIDLVYGLDVPRGAAPLLRETLFFARLGEGHSGGEAPGGRMRWRRAAARLLPSRKVRELIPVPRNGRVITDAIAERLPPCERLFTLGHLFYLGARHFRRYGRFLTVRVAEPPAIMHWTYPVPVRLAGALNLYTIHDLVPLRLPFTSLEDKIYHEALLRECAATAGHIVTVSEASRRDLVEQLGLDPACVANTYQSLPAAAETPLDEAAGAAEDARIAALFGLNARDYFLFVGAIEPKKNVGRLIEAYLSSGVATPLVVAGPRAWAADEELQLITGGGCAGRVRRIDYLPAGQLRTLMRGARALLFPSLYEGFGLPVLEAMAMGVPVLAGNAGALPEIVGDAGLLVDPYDVAALGEAIARLDGDELLRMRLGRAALTRAKRFSIAAYRRRLDALHARLLGPGEHWRTGESGVSPFDFQTGDVA